MNTTIVTRHRDADGEYCAACDQVFDISTSPYWDWSKSAAMHRDGTGHRVELFRIERAA